MNKKKQTEFEFEGDPDGPGPMPHGKYKFTGGWALLITGLVCFLAGVGIGILI